MANWKKMVTYNEGGKIEGSITGVAYGGFEGILSMTHGGTGSDTASWNAGTMPVFSGGSLTSIPAPAGNDQVLVSSSNAPYWEWKSVGDTHNHDSAYLKQGNASSQQITGNLHVLGALVADSVEVADFSQITAATSGAIALNVTGGSADGNECGMFCDINGNTTLETGDPMLVWSSSSNRFEAGTKGGNVHPILLFPSSDIDSE